MALSGGAARHSTREGPARVEAQTIQTQTGTGGALAMVRAMLPSAQRGAPTARNGPLAPTGRPARRELRPGPAVVAHAAPAPAPGARRARPEGSGLVVTGLALTVLAAARDGLRSARDGSTRAVPTAMRCSRLFPQNSGR